MISDLWRRNVQFTGHTYFTFFVCCFIRVPSICVVYYYIHINTLLLVQIIYIQSNLGSRTPRITNSSVYEQIFRTQTVSDDVLCLELRTRKPSKRRQNQIALDNFLVRQRPSGSEAESSGAKRQKKEKESPSKQ